MKRFLSLALVLVLVFGAIMPSFAEVTTEDLAQETQDLVAYGIIEGDGTSMNEEGPLTRAAMAKILAYFYGEQETAETYAFEPTFSDMEENAWYLPWVAYAEAQGWMIGGGEGSEFRPNEAMIAQEANMLMLRVLGYGDTPYAEANEKAAELEVAITAEDPTLVLRLEAFKAIRNVLDAKPMGEEVALGSQLELEGYVAPEPPAPEAVAVESVTADNLKALTIMFNMEIDADYLDEIAVTPASTLTLSEDKMSVVAVYDAAIAQGTEVEIEIEDLEYEWAQRVYDMQDPTLLSIAANSPKELVMTFSEPVDMDDTNSFKVYNNIKRDNISLVAKITDVNQVTNEVTLELPSLLAAGTYNFDVTAIEDFAGFEIPAAEFDVVIEEDNTAPVATGVEVKNLTTVEVTFDETIAVKGTFEVDGVDETDDTVIDGKVATITVPELSLSATVEVRVEYKGQKDLVGNEVENFVVITTSVEDDTTLPEAALVVEEGNDVTITFTKSMLTDVGTITVNDSDDDEVVALDVDDLTFEEDTNNTVLELTAAQLGLDETDPATYSIVIEDMQDATVRKNLLPDATFTVNAEDTKNPVIEEEYLLTEAEDEDDEDEVTFYFSELMDEDSVKNLSNYIVVDGNKTVSNITDAKYVSMTSTSVTLQIPGAKAAGDDYLLIGLKDVAGNLASSTEVTLAGDVDIDIISVTATDANTVVVEFDATVSSVDPSAFYLADGVLTDEDTENLVFTSATIDGDEVTFTIDGELPADLEGTDDWKLIANNTELVVNLYGNDLSDNFPAEDEVSYGGGDDGEGVDIDDEIAPSISGVNTLAAAGANANVIVLDFDEDVTHTDAAFEADLKVEVQDGASTYQIPFGDYVATNVSGNIHLTLQAGADAIDNKEITVELLNGRYVDDGDGNLTTAFDAMTVQNSADDADAIFDTAAPTITSVVLTDEDADGNIETATVTFSEDMDDTTIAAFLGGNGTFTIGGEDIITGDTGDTADDAVYVFTTADGGAIGTGLVDLIFTVGVDTLMPEDIQENKLANVAGGDIVETDEAAPVMLSLAAADSTTAATITFSEDVTNEALSATTHLTTTQDGVAGTATAVADATGGDADVAIVLSVNAVTDEATVVTLTDAGALLIEDAAGNTADVTNVTSVTDTP